MKKFSGKRIKSARLYNGLTVEELAEQLNVSKQAVSQYENEQINPPFEKGFLLSKILKFPVDYFFSESNVSISTGTTYFRSLLRTNSKSRTQQEAKMEHIAIIYSFLNQFVEFPDLDLPKFGYEITPKEAANELRMFWELGDEPISNITELLESKGILITTFETDTDDIDAFSQREVIDGKEVFIIAISKNKNSAARFQFDVAHELGHIILHEWSEDLELLDKSKFKEHEKEANEFASEFLMPSASFSRDSIGMPNKIEAYIHLKRKWNVSIGAMAYKNRELGLITQRQYQYLMSYMNKNNLRTHEPLDDTIPIPRPTMFSDAVELLLEENVFTAASFVKELSLFGLPMNYEEIETLLNLDEDLLKPTSKFGSNKINLKSLHGV